MSTEPGVKHDNGKPRPALVVLGFPRAMAALAAVAAYGAGKYTDDGWSSVPNGISRYTDAMLRHLIAEPLGPIDDESGYLHAAHTAWNALARLELLLRGRAAE